MADERVTIGAVKPQGDLLDRQVVESAAWWVEAGAWKRSFGLKPKERATPEIIVL
jgi:hypothetical protein